MDTIKWNDSGLIPAVIQDAYTKEVLMLGYMNEAALKKTQAGKYVTFYSRSKERLWTKGEESGNYLEWISIKNDCDNDTLLIQVKPLGPTCHKGTTTCWGEPERSIIDELENTISGRLKGNDEGSYVKSLSLKGVEKVAQKVGEEAVETVIEACKPNFDETLFLNESADLLFHYLFLLQMKGYKLADVEKVLRERRKK